VHRPLSRPRAAALYCPSHQPTDALSAIDASHAQPIVVAFALPNENAIQDTDGRSDTVTYAVAIAESVLFAEPQSDKVTDGNPYGVTIPRAD